MEAKSDSGSLLETPVNAKNGKRKASSVGEAKGSRPKKQSRTTDLMNSVGFVYDAHIDALQALRSGSVSLPTPFADPHFKLIAYMYFKRKYALLGGILYYPEHLLQHLELLLAYAHHIKAKQLYAYFERIHQQYNRFVTDTYRSLKTQDIKKICSDSKVELTDDQKIVIENILQEEKNKLLQFGEQGSSSDFFNVLVNLSVILSSPNPDAKDVVELKKEIIQQSEIKYMHAFTLISGFVQKIKKNSDSECFSMLIRHLIVGLNELLGFQFDNTYLVSDQLVGNDTQDEKASNLLTRYEGVSESNSLIKIYMSNPELHEGMAVCGSDFKDQKDRIQLIKNLIDEGDFEGQEIPLPSFVYKLHQAATSGHLSLAFKILRDERSDFINIVNMTHTASYVKLIVAFAAILSVNEGQGNDTCYMGDQDCLINSKVILSFFSTLFAAYHSGSDPSIKSLITLEGGYLSGVMREVMEMLFKSKDCNRVFLIGPPSHHMSIGKSQGFCVMSPAAIVLCMQIQRNIDVVCLGTDINADNGLVSCMPYLLSLLPNQGSVRHLDLHSRRVFPSPERLYASSNDGYTYIPHCVDEKPFEEILETIKGFFYSPENSVGFVLNLLGLDSSNQETAFCCPGPFSSSNYEQVQRVIESSLPGRS